MIYCFSFFKNVARMSIFLSLVLLGYLSAESLDQKNPHEIKLLNCLQEEWGVEANTAVFIIQYFKPFFEENKHQGPIIEDFIDKTKRLNIQFPLDKKITALPDHDGVIQATKYHPVVYETPFVRILAGCAEPGEREPFHTHIWRSLLVVFEESHYFVEYADGSLEYLNLLPGTYELPPENLYACTNIGKNKENCLRFEVKD
jgi:hypothetical protein